MRGLNSPNAAGRVQEQPQGLKFFTRAGAADSQLHHVQLCCLTFLQEKEVVFGGLGTSSFPFIPKPHYGGFCAWLKLLEGLNGSGSPQRLTWGAEGGRRAAVCVENTFSRLRRAKSAPTADPVHLGTELKSPVRLRTWGGPGGTHGRAGCPCAAAACEPLHGQKDPRPTTGPGAWPGGGEQPQMPLAKLGMERHGGSGGCFPEPHVCVKTIHGSFSSSLSPASSTIPPPGTQARRGMAGMGRHRALLAGMSKATGHND